MNVRRSAYNVLGEITQKGAYANLSLKKALENASPDDAGWVSAAVYTTLDNLIYIDYVIDRYAKGRVQPAIRNILRLGLCQLLFMKVPANAACDETVKLAKQVGKGALAGYINAVMRSVARADAIPLPTDKRKRLSVSYSYPEWLLDMLCEDYGEMLAEKLMQPVRNISTVRAQYPFTTEDLIGKLTARGTAYSKGEFEADAIKVETGCNYAADSMFAEGKLSIQSESAMLVCRILAPRQGMCILDACAAPGGKSAYIASLIKNNGHIDAWELHAHRTQLIKNTMNRLHVDCVSPQTCDASIEYTELKEHYDAVLVDAPCSGLGVSGKPDIKYAKSPDAVQELIRIQHDILAACACYVKPGGALVYSTCTMLKAENERQIARFLSEHDEFAADDITTCLPEEKRDRVKDGMLQLLPCIDGTDGFFIARLRRKKQEYT